MTTKQLFSQWASIDRISFQAFLKWYTEKYGNILNINILIDKYPMVFVIGVIKEFLHTNYSIIVYAEIEFGMTYYINDEYPIAKISLLTNSLVFNYYEMFIKVFEHFKKPF